MGTGVGIGCMGGGWGGSGERIYFVEQHTTFGGVTRVADRD